MVAPDDGRAVIIAHRIIPLARRWPTFPRKRLPPSNDCSQRLTAIMLRLTAKGTDESGMEASDKIAT
ncbi:hypothetical protein AYR66_13710 [Noviherbaspirillum denitrificans]|uniref:Uncharacterized protein n=1 Tax=Noviherbaspirillum denitrificans TaxID=1968433 RepID=A0A254TCK1_9BURK|nr:hypothetical protein AYR66_13710 [Noviherbaspirillum denitrificans]